MSQNFKTTYWGEKIHFPFPKRPRINKKEIYKNAQMTNKHLKI